MSRLISSIRVVSLAGWMVFAVSGVVEARSSNSAQIAAKNGSTASGGADCTQCHTPTGSPGSVQIIGAPLSYSAGGVYDLTVRVSDSTKAGAGFQISVEDAGGAHVGTLTITDAVNTALNAGDPNWVNHTSTGVSNATTNWVANGNQADFNVRWTAPPGDEGPVTFWAVGNAINAGGSPADDNVYLTDVTATFSPAVPAVSEWGLVVLMLILLSAASAVLVQRERAVLLRPIRDVARHSRGG